MQLEKKVAAVTGGSAGIGRAIAEAFLAEGAKVTIMARNADKASRVLEEIGAGENLVFIQGDATNQGDVESFIDKTVETFGSIDILVNNAGGATDLQPLVNLSDEEVDHCMKWNVYSTFWATRRALRTMLEQKWGRVINISSMEGKHGKPVFGAYTAAKHAINGMTKSVASGSASTSCAAPRGCPAWRMFSFAIMGTGRSRMQRRFPD